MNRLLSFLLLLGVVSVAWGNAANPFDSSAPFKPQGEIDTILLRRLKELQIEPANLCADSVFVRRAYLDVIGTLPTPQEVNTFLGSRDPNKRRALVERLLEREEFADYWAMKWCDVLRVKAEFPINLWPNAAQAYHRWIRSSIKENKPYDRFARELLTSSGSNFRVGPVNFYRALQNREPKGVAQAVALTFMGCRAEKWPEAKLDGMSLFFSRLGYKSTAEWKEEIVYFEWRGTNTLSSDASVQATFPDGTTASLSPGRDPREQFTDWLISAENPWFARAMANRAWSWFFGRGIVHEADDLRDDNPPAHPELLRFLETELVKNGYDMKALFRLILNSSTYQLSPISKEDPQTSEVHFAHYPLRRLDAEVLIDAINQITDSRETYTSAIPEPFTYIPEDQRSIALPDGSITSPFLELFGRPSRDTGLESERNNRSTAAQRLHLLNSSSIQKKIERCELIPFLLKSKSNSRGVVSSLYLTILSRYPTSEELSAVETYARSGNVRNRESLVDITWALMNSAEFLYRH